MTVTFNVSADISKAVARLRAIPSQVQFATALALTRTAQDVQREVTAQLPIIFDRPIPFTQRAIRIVMASKASLTSSVYIMPIAARYLAAEIAGGIETPMGKMFALPTNYPRDQYGNVPRGAVKRLLQRPDVFSGRVRGIAGIWQRLPGGRISLLFLYVPKALHRKEFDFAAIAEGVIQRRLLPNFAEALRVAMATAR
jgi:hypothetical protein